MVVYLLGFMGSGKSTMGKKLSNRIGMTYIDLDSVIEDFEGRSIARIFADKGEAYFRKIESEVLRSQSETPDSVISCGGGTPCFNNNMEYMNASGETVYLQMTAGALISRLKNSRENRPLIADMDDRDLNIYITKTLGERDRWYRMAKHTVDGLNPDITQLAQLLQAPDPCSR